MRPQAAFAAILAISLAACSADPAGDVSTQWQGTIEERDGVVYIHNPAEGLWEGRDPLPVRLELEQVFGVDQEPGDAILGFPAALTVDGDGNVYVLDLQADALVVFDPDGNVLWRLDRHGEGPGDINHASYVGWNGDRHLYISNQTSHRIDVFDLEGNYLKSQGLADFDIIQGRLAGFLDPDTPVLWNSVRGRLGAEVYVFDAGDPWSSRTVFFAEGGPDSADQWSTGHIPVRVGEGRVHAGHCIEYLLKEFDADGNLRRVITRDFRRLVPPVYRYGTGRSFGMFEASMVLPGGYRLVPVSWATNVESAEDFIAQIERHRAEGQRRPPEVEYGSAFDFLDKEGRYLGSLTWEGYFPDTGIVDEIGPDGRLYTWWMEPFPQVRRYRVVIDE